VFTSPSQRRDKSGDPIPGGRSGKCVCDFRQNPGRRDNRPLVLRREGSRFFVMLIGAIETSDKIEGVGEDRLHFFG
jgi:hypothetical protein